MQKAFLVLLFLLLSSSIYADIVYGYIKDASSGEALIGASVYLKSKSVLVTSNSYGYYLINCNEVNDTLIISYMGYESATCPLSAIRMGRNDFFLKQINNEINEVVVSSKPKFMDLLENARMSYHSITAAKIKSIPTAFGESDVLKSLQFLPGVNSICDATTNLSVRGGSYDQNLILLDEATVYNPSHSMGVFSAFNPDAIKSVEFYKSGFPVQYGNMMSSVADIKMREGNIKQSKFSGGLGLISTRFVAEGPIKLDTASFLISGRLGYGDVVTNILSHFDKIYNHSDDRIRFYDLSGKVNYTVTKNDRIYFSSYTGGDKFHYSIVNNDNDIYWSNITGTLRWNHIFNNRLFANTSVVYSNYHYTHREYNDVRHFDWNAGMLGISFKSDLDYFKQNNRIKFGFSVEYHKYNPGEIKPFGQYSIITPLQLEQKRSIITSVYLSNEYRFSEKLAIYYGGRFSGFVQPGPGRVYEYSQSLETVTDSVQYSANSIIQSYFGLDPRVTINYRIGEFQTLKAGYTISHQYQHLLSNSALGMPTDIWIPSSKYIRPQISNQISFGYYAYVNKCNLELSMESYYKKNRNIIDFKDNADIRLNKQVETEILSGIGEAYGVELLVARNSRLIDFSISYTLSKATHTIEGINNNNPYPALYDQRHNFSVNTLYRFSKNWSFAANFKYHTGGRSNVPEGAFFYLGNTFTYYSERNSYKLPDFHRLDIAFTHDRPTKEGRRWHSQWIFGLYNAYARNNPYSIAIKPEYISNGLTTKAYMLYFFKVIPYVSYNFEF